MIKSWHKWRDRACVFLHSKRMTCQSIVSLPVPAFPHAIPAHGRECKPLINYTQLNSRPHRLLATTLTSGCKPPPRHCKYDPEITVHVLPITPQRAQTPLAKQERAFALHGHGCWTMAASLQIHPISRHGQTN